MNTTPAPAHEKDKGIYRLYVDGSLVREGPKELIISEASAFLLVHPYYRVEIVPLAA